MLERNSITDASSRGPCSNYLDGSQVNTLSVGSNNSISDENFTSTVSTKSQGSQRDPRHTSDLDDSVPQLGEHPTPHSDPKKRPPLTEANNLGATAPISSVSSAGTTRSRGTAPEVFSKEAFLRQYNSLSDMKSSKPLNLTELSVLASLKQRHYSQTPLSYAVRVSDADLDIAARTLASLAPVDPAALTAEGYTYMCEAILDRPI